MDRPKMIAVAQRTVSAPRGHILTVVKSNDFDPESPDFDFSIECLNVDECGGWTVCDEKHEVAGRSALCGPYECDCGGEDGPSCLGDEPGEGNHPRPPWYDQEDFEFHGIVHEWKYGHGWAVPFKGCVVADNDYVCDSAHEIALKHGCGRHEVDDEWDDDFECTLVHVRALDDLASPSAV